MAEGRLRVGGFVRYGGRNGRVGQVKRMGSGNPAVEFWSDRNSGELDDIPAGLLTLVADDSPEALLWQRPEELESWANERPLQLVALVLSIEGGTGKTADIKEKLDGRVPLGSKYASWWSRTRPKFNLPEPQEHVKIEKGVFTLISNFREVPQDADLGTFLLSEWSYWLSNETDVPPPWGRWPKAETFVALDSTLEQLCDIEAEQALLLVMNGAEEFLVSVKTPRPAATNWLETVGRTFLRWRDCTRIDSYSDHTPRAIGILAGLCEIVGYAKSGQQWLLLAHDDDSWQHGVAAGMWASSRGSNDRARRRSLFQAASELLGRQGRADLAREIALSALRVEYTPPRHLEIDQYLQDLAGGEDTVRHLYELIAFAATTEAEDKVLDYIANSRHASGPEKLGLRLMASLALAKGRGEFAERTSRDLADALEASEVCGPEMQAILADATARLSMVISNKDREIAELHKANEVALESERQVQERLQERVKTFEALMASGREESRFEVRQGMLLAVGDALQRAYLQGKSAEDRLGNVISTLPNALLEGGATTLGKVGDSVAYDSRYHHSSEAIPTGANVCVAAPGVKVGERVILKASVSIEAEVL